MHFFRKFVYSLLSFWLVLLSLSSSDASTASDNVLILENINMPQLERQRTVRVYLPPNYDNTTKRYPVIYMHDAQNLFDEATAYSQEWKIDEILNELANDIGLELIVIGIDNGPRDDEYSPWKNWLYGGGEGAQYVDFIVHSLKPEVDTNLRTLTEREHTAIMGSSMGALISHYAIFKYPDIFSKAGLFSPSYWFSKRVKKFTKNKVTTVPKDTKLSFISGSKEPYSIESGTLKMVAQLKEDGFPASNIYSRIEKGGKHTEDYWGKYFRESVIWLFANPSTTANTP